MRNNKISYDGAVAIANAIKDAPLLEEIDLRGNKINGKGAQAFVKAVEAVETHTVSVLLQSRKAFALKHKRSSINAGPSRVSLLALKNIAKRERARALFMGGRSGKVKALKDFDCFYLDQDECGQGNSRGVCDWWDGPSDDVWKTGCNNICKKTGGAVVCKPLTDSASKKQYAQILSTLPEFAPFRAIEFSYMTNNAANVIVKRLAKVNAHQVETLALVDGMITNKGASAISRALKKYKVLLKLSLKNNYIKDDGLLRLPTLSRTAHL